MATYHLKLQTLNHTKLAIDEMDLHNCIKNEENPNQPPLGPWPEPARVKHLPRAPLYGWLLAYPQTLSYAKKACHGQKH